MAKARRKAIRLQPHEADQIRTYYLARGIPIDQYAKRPMDFASFIEGWNRLSERDDSPEDVRHYMLTQRKGHFWPTFDGQHEKMSELPQDMLSEEEWDALRAACSALMAPDQLGSDVLAYDADLGRSLAQAFAREAGRYLDPPTLYALVMARRKDKDWFKVGSPKPTNPGIGFSDIDEIAS